MEQAVKLGKDVYKRSRTRVSEAEQVLSRMHDILCVYLLDYLSFHLK